MHSFTGTILNFFLLFHYNLKDKVTTGKKFVTTILSLGWYLGQTRYRDLSNTSWPCALAKKKNNNCNEMCKMETRRSLSPYFALFCYFMSHLNHGRFYLLGETLELQGWLSMEEISLGVVKSLSLKAFKNRLEKRLSRIVCVAEPALGRKIDWPLRLSSSPILMINPQRECIYSVLHLIWVRM